MKWPLGEKKKKAAQIEFPGSSQPLHWSRPPPRETPHISITRTPTRRVYRRTQPIYKLKRRYLPESEPRNGISIPPLGSQLRGIKRAPSPPPAALISYGCEYCSLVRGAHHQFHPPPPPHTHRHPVSHADEAPLGRDWSLISGSSPLCKRPLHQPRRRATDRS